MTDTGLYNYDAVLKSLTMLDIYEIPSLNIPFFFMWAEILKRDGFVFKKLQQTF